MHKYTFEEVSFTATMVFIMVAVITFYNRALATGGCTWADIAVTASTIWPAYLFAFSFELLWAKPFALRVMVRVAGENGRAPLRIFVMALAMVSQMCPVMSLFMAIRLGGIDATLPLRWILMILRTYPFALCLQLFVAGPLVRALFSRVFKH